MQLLGASMRFALTDHKEVETTSRLRAAGSKVGSCCVPSEGGRPRLGVIKSATSATETVHRSRIICKVFTGPLTRSAGQTVPP
jgi:hypothetical protein